MNTASKQQTIRDFFTELRAEKAAAAKAANYEAGGYMERLDYTALCVPPLSSEDQRWADALIREALAQG